MKNDQIKIGMRVRIRKNGLTALVVSNPESYTATAKLVRIKYEFSTRYEHMINHQIDILPMEEQFPHFGGTFTRPEGLY